MTHPYGCKNYALGFVNSNTSLEYSPLLDTWLLARRINNTQFSDLTHCYPRCAINPTTDLADALNHLQALNYISFTLCTDVYIVPPITKLQANFDYLRPFKRHYVHDYTKALTISKHHRYEIRKARKQCQIETVSFIDYFDTWCTLYQNLINRHQITGIQHFSRTYFNQLQHVDDLTTIAAFNQNGECLAMHLWLCYQDIVYSHLAASSQQGYLLGASYAIHQYAIDYFNEKHYLDFGACAGLNDDANDGLARFKRGFSNCSKVSYLCGKIFNSSIYENLSNQVRYKNDDYFPQYRCNEQNNKEKSARTITK